MLRIGWVVLAAALVGLGEAVPRPAPVPAGHVVHEKRDLNSQSSWVKRSRLDTAAILPVRIGLTQNNLDRAHDMLMEVSHPDSPKYGQWWSAEAVHDFFAPSTEAVDMVRTWIKSAGIADDRIVHSENKGWLAVDTTVEEAEMLFATTFYEYEHSYKDETSVGTDSYHVPEHLTAHIDYVTPGLKRVRAKKRTVTTAKGNRGAGAVKRSSKLLELSLEIDQKVEDLAEGISPLGNIVNGLLPQASAAQLDPSLQNCTYEMTMTCLQALYGIPANPQAVEGNSVGVFEMADYFDQPDLDMYFAAHAPWVVNGTQPIPALINGAMYSTSQDDTDNVGGEALIDITIAQAMVYPQNVTLYQVDDIPYALEQVTSENDTILFNNFLNALDGSYCTYSAYGQTGNDPDRDPVYPNSDPTGYQGQLMCGTYKPTKVIAISYGGGETDVPPNYQKRECDEILKLGLMGTTVVMATGDDGVACYSDDPEPNGCLGPDHTIFHPPHLVTCPYITAVGATMLGLNQTILDPESALYQFSNHTGQPPRNFSTAGGFSTIHGRPQYQHDAVQYYLDNYVPAYPYYEQLEPDFNTVQGIYNRIGRGYPDVSMSGWNYPVFISGEELHVIGTSLSAPAFAGLLTLINQERALLGKDSVGFVNPTIYAHPEVFTDIVNGTNPGCGTLGFPATPRWDPITGLGTPIYAKMLELYLSLP